MVHTKIKPVASRQYSPELLTKWAMPILDKESGQLLEYRQLRGHPKYHVVWNDSYFNELGRLCQGVGTNADGTGQPIDGTDTFFVISYRRKEVTYTKVVCMYRPDKDDPNRTCHCATKHGLCFWVAVGLRSVAVRTEG